MPKARKPSLMSVDEYRSLIERHSLRHKDVAWMTGYGERHARDWGLATTGYPVPAAVALLLRAFDQGKITAAWLAEQLGSEPPA